MLSSLVVYCLTITISIYLLVYRKIVMNTEKIFLIGALFFALLTFFFLLGCVENNPAPGPIGGDKDANGCLSAAGYSYDSDIGACIRPWELDQNQRIVATIVTDSVSYEKITIIGVVEQECEGCFNVKFNDADGLMYEVIIKDWMVDYSNQLKENKVVYDSKNKRLLYSFEVMKPTPCYEVKKDILILESYPVQVVINVEFIPLQTFAPCVQVIDPEIISGEILIDHKPASVMVNVDGEEFFKISEIVDAKNPENQIGLI